MSVKNLQNEKIVEEIIGRLTSSHGIECRKTVEENRSLQSDLEIHNQQLKLLSEQNKMKDLWLDEIMEKICDARRSMAKQAEQSTRVHL